VWWHIVAGAERRRPVSVKWRGGHQGLRVVSADGGKTNEACWYWVQAMPKIAGANASFYDAS